MSKAYGTDRVGVQSAARITIPPSTNVDRRSEWNAAIAYLDSLDRTPSVVLELMREEALRRYPCPKEPTVVTIWSDREYRVSGGLVQTRSKGDGAWLPSLFTVAELLALGKIAQQAQQEMGK